MFGGDEGLTDAAGEGDDGEVLAGALDLGLSELRVRLACWSVGKKVGCLYRNDKVVPLDLLADGERETVQKPGLR